MAIDVPLDVGVRYDKDGKPRFYTLGEYRVPQHGEFTIDRDGCIYETFMEPSATSLRENIAVEIQPEVAIAKIIEALVG